MNVVAIFAGGVGSRMGCKIPKQFLEIYGRPIIVHTLEKFQYNDNIDCIYIGCMKKYIPLMKSLIKKYNLTKVKPECIIQGGKYGLETIYNLLKVIHKDHEGATVLIHDGVRPNITDSVINKNIEGVERYGNAITCVSTVETSIISNNGKDVDEFLDRKKVYLAKAPQSFKINDIVKAYDNVLEKYGTFDVEGLIDSCSVALSYGMKLKMIEGSRNNIKVTTPNDYIDILGRMISNDYNNFFEMSKEKK